MTSNGSNAVGDSTKNAVALLFAEILFIVLPLVVLAIVLWNQGKLPDILSRPEWALSAAILFGQALIKFIMGVIADRSRFALQVIAAYMAGLIVLGLVPSLIVLALVLLATESNPVTNAGVHRISLGLTVAQLSLFGVAMLIFFVLGGKGQKLLEQRVSAST
jgi:hypothetical protein